MYSPILGGDSCDVKLVKDLLFAALGHIPLIVGVRPKPNCDELIEQCSQRSDRVSKVNEMTGGSRLQIVLSSQCSSTLLRL